MAASGGQNSSKKDGWDDDDWFGDLMNDYTQNEKSGAKQNSANNNQDSNNGGNNNDDFFASSNEEAVPWWWFDDSGTNGANNVSNSNNKDVALEIASGFDSTKQEANASEKEKMKQEKTKTGNDTAGSDGAASDGMSDVDITFDGESEKRKKKKKKKESEQDDSSSREEDKGNGPDRDNEAAGPVPVPATVQAQGSSKQYNSNGSYGNGGSNMDTSKNGDSAYRLAFNLDIIMKKFILFNTIFVFLAIMMFAIAVYNGFYETKGYLSNMFVVAGLFAGLWIALTDYKNYKRTIRSFGWYFAVACFVILALFLVALVYSCLFPSKYASYCDDEDNDCDADTFSTAFGTISAFLLSILWLTLMLFYVDILSRIVILVSQLYTDTRSLSGVPRLSVKYAFKFRSKWRHVRYWFADHTGCRVDDCCFGDCCGQRDSAHNRQQREQRRHEYNQKRNRSSCVCDCSDPFCMDCMCRACIHICCAPSNRSYGGSSSSAGNSNWGGNYGGYGGGAGYGGGGYGGGNNGNNNGNNNGSNNNDMATVGATYAYHGQTSDTCCNCPSVSCPSCRCPDLSCPKCSCPDIDCPDCDCDLNCGSSCDCGGCDGEGAIVILGLAAVVAVFLSPLVVLAALTIPFWFLGQWLIGNCFHGANMCAVAMVFTVLLIIPMVIWYAAYSLVCESAGAFCWLWWLFKAVIEL